MPPRVQEAMQMQVEAERKKRATILESEGVREADINIAEGQRAAKILASGISLCFLCFCALILHLSITIRRIIC